MLQPISFQLLAPNNPEVKLIGSWNQWQAQTMCRHDDGYWRCQLPLDDGDYEYLFEVVSCTPSLQGKRVRVPDPCALEWTADEKTRLHIHNGERFLFDYAWQHDDVPLPPNEQLIIYELHVGDFTATENSKTGEYTAGTLRGVIEKLDYLVELGINAIELMPLVATIPGRQLGYSQRSFFALNPRYGTPRDLRNW